MSPTTEPSTPRRRQPEPRVEEPTQAAELRVKIKKLGSDLSVKVPGSQANLLLLIVLGLGVIVGPTLFVWVAAAPVSGATALVVVTLQVAALVTLFIRVTRK